MNLTPSPPLLEEAALPARTRQEAPSGWTILGAQLWTARAISMWRTTANHTLRMVTPVGTNWVVTTLAGLAQNPGSADGINRAARFANPYGVAVNNAGTVYVVERGKA